MKPKVPIMQALLHKNVLITGASEGIGLAMARAFAQEGAQVILLARRPARMGWAVAELEAEGVVARGYQGDVRDGPGLAELMLRIDTEVGGLYGVVANAGMCSPGRCAEAPDDAYHMQVDTNFKGALHTLRMGARLLAPRRSGFLAGVSSPAGRLPIPGMAAYGATKAGLEHFLASLRLEMKPHGVNVHTLYPPDTDTPGYAREATMYPPETRRILGGGRTYPVELVASRLVTAIARGKPHATVGREAELAMLVQRLAPWLWHAYVRRAMRIAAREEPAKAPAAEKSGTKG